MKKNNFLVSHHFSLMFLGPIYLRRLWHFQVFHSIRTCHHSYTTQKCYRISKSMLHTTGWKNTSASKQWLKECCLLSSQSVLMVEVKEALLCALMVSNGKLTADTYHLTPLGLIVLMLWLCVMGECIHKHKLLAHMYAPGHMHVCTCTLPCVHIVCNFHNYGLTVA